MTGHLHARPACGDCKDCEDCGDVSRLAARSRLTADRLAMAHDAERVSATCRSRRRMSPQSSQSPQSPRSNGGRVTDPTRTFGDETHNPRVGGGTTPGRITHRIRRRIGGRDDAASCVASMGRDPRTRRPACTSNSFSRFAPTGEARTNPAHLSRSCGTPRHLGADGVVDHRTARTAADYPNRSPHHVLGQRPRHPCGAAQAEAATEGKDSL